jgi:hypothetical protein
VTTAIIRFPPRRAAAVCEERDGDGWFVLAPRGHGWLHGSLAQACADARWLARNLGLPIRVTGGAP